MLGAYRNRLNLNNLYCRSSFPIFILLLCSPNWIVNSASGEDETTIATSSEINLNDHHGAHSRQKRYVYINTNSPVDIGFLVVVPYSFALPTFNLQTSRRFKKSISVEQELLANLTEDEILPKDSFDEPAYSIETRKMEGYFATLKIDEDICQRKIICEIFSSPESYSPLSDMLAKNLIADHGPMVENSSSRYYRYVLAMQDGVSGGEPKCKSEFSRCPYSTQDRLNMPALLFWNWLTNLLSMDFRD